MNDHQEWVTSTLDLLEKTPLRESYIIGLWANALGLHVLKKIETEFDITRDEFNTMFTLAIKKQALATDICQLNSRPKNSISRAVNKLYKRGALTKQPMDTDRRKELLSLTNLGYSLYEQTIPFFIQRQSELLQPLTYDERRQLELLLKKALSEGPDWR